MRRLSEAVLPGWPDCEAGEDRNANGAGDRRDIREGTGNRIPDSCECWADRDGELTALDSICFQNAFMTGCE